MHKNATFNSNQAKSIDTKKSEEYTKGVKLNT